MPFIRNVVLVVSSPTQVPAWINQNKVRVVYHKDFIPESCLPTFNSCVIESFFWNIPDLSDRVIYLNDDMFPIGPMQEIDFFTGNVPHIRFKHPEVYSEKNIFVSQSRSSMDMITKVLGLPAYEKGKILLPYHASQAITQTGLAGVKNLCATELPSRATAVRTSNNINQYIYAYYQYFTNNYIDITVNYKYFEIRDDSINLIEDQLSKEDACQMICLNDSDRVKDYPKLRTRLSKCFELRFPDKCKYEL